MSWVSSLTDGRALLNLHIQPKASRSRLVGLHGDRLKIAVMSPPVDGKANKALLKYLAQTLGVAVGDLELVSGETSRQKRVAVSGMDESVLRLKMRELVANI